MYIKRFIRFLLSRRVKISINDWYVPLGSLILANHPSLLDGVIIWAYFSKVTPVANEYQTRYPIVGKIIEKECIIVPVIFHSQFTRPEQIIMTRAAVTKCQILLMLRKSIILFPMGALEGSKYAKPGGLPRRILEKVPNVRVCHCTIETDSNNPFIINKRTGKKPNIYLGLIKLIFRRKKLVYIITNTEIPNGH